MLTEMLAGISKCDIRSISRAISYVENEFEEYQDLLKSLNTKRTHHILGITGPPGAGKSTLTDALIQCFVNDGKKVAIICVDPSSPFNYGALLGDRIRMGRWHDNDLVYIRSLATRGSLGGLHSKIIEITDILVAGGFDEIILETVGVGQSEVEISGIADTTVVVLVPESGDEIQTMKAGIMEIADIFVVNKADRPEADHFIKHLKMMLAPSFSNKTETIEIIKTIATNNTGIDELYKTILRHGSSDSINEKRSYLLAEKAFLMIQAERMKGIEIKDIRMKIEQHIKDKNFNIYQFIQDYK